MISNSAISNQLFNLDIFRNSCLVDFGNFALAFGDTRNTSEASSFWMPIQSTALGSFKRPKPDEELSEYAKLTMYGDEDQKLEVIIRSP